MSRKMNVKHMMSLSINSWNEGGENILRRPMRLVYSYGCTANELSVDGVPEIALNNATRKKVISRIFQWYKKHPEQLNSLLAYFIEQAGDYEIGIRCEECGDTPITYTIDI